jgi:chromosome partitioning protein
MWEISHMSHMTQIVAVCNQKGGVGKTTLTINLGAALASLGQRVLLVDVDPQGHLTEGVGFQDLYLDQHPTLHDCLVGDGKVQIEQLIQKHPVEPFSVIPSSYELMLAEQDLFKARNREHKLRASLAPIDGRFDWILIDCPPMIGQLTDNALNAARQVVIPVQAEATSVRALELLFDQIESLERGLGIEVRVLAVIPNLVQDSTLSKRILSEMRSSVPQLVPFELRKRVMLQVAWSSGRSIFGFGPTSSSDAATRDEIMNNYRELAHLVMDRVKEGDRDG